MIELGILTIVLACAFITLFYQNRLRRAEGVVRGAKREAMEAATLSFNTPYPLIHLARNGTIIFANPAAKSAFPDLMKAGMSHTILSNLDEFWSAEKKSSIR